jgi:hypothetical protein
MKDIPLTQGKVALVDDDDFERVSAFKWHAHLDHGNWYARRWVKATPSTIYLHRFVMDAPCGVQVDHWNGDGLDCQKSNLRRATHEQNTRNARLRKDNTTGFKGVARVTGKTCVAAQIWHDNKLQRIGYFDSPTDAARAYDSVAREVYGHFARLNFPLPGELGLNGETAIGAD